MTKRKMGRPSKYRSSVAKAICMRMMDGESLRSICERKLYPARRTVLYWLASKEEFLRQYTQAREIQQELLYEECFDIADDGSNDWYMKQGKNGGEYPVVDHEHVNRSRLRIDTRKWAMERMAAKKYGNKNEVVHSGAVNNVNYTPESYKEAQEKLEGQFNDLD